MNTTKTGRLAKVFLLADHVDGFSWVWGIKLMELSTNGTILHASTPSYHMNSRMLAPPPWTLFVCPPTMAAETLGNLRTVTSTRHTSQTRDLDGSLLSVSPTVVSKVETLTLEQRSYNVIINV